MKKKHAYLKTAVWHREKIKDPHQVIAKAFDFAGVHYYRHLIEGVLNAAVSDKVFRKKEPGKLLDEFEKLEGLINAAYIFVAEKTTSPVHVQESDLMNKNLYCGRHKSNSEWDYFPRHLTKQEFCDPYLVFKSFFEFQSIEHWKIDLKELLEHALISYYDKPEVDVLAVYTQLLKLVEAAHLIDVREVTHIDGYIKNRF